MADKPVTLLERLNDVLERLSTRLGYGPQAGGPGGLDTYQAPNAAGTPASFLDPIKRLLERIAQIAEKALGSRSRQDDYFTGTMPTSTPPGTQAAQAPPFVQGTTNWQKAIDAAMGRDPNATGPYNGPHKTPTVLHPLRYDPNDPNAYPPSLRPLVFGQGAPQSTVGGGVASALPGPPPASQNSNQSNLSPDDLRQARTDPGAGRNSDIAARIGAVVNVGSDIARAEGAGEALGGVFGTVSKLGQATDSPTGKAVAFVSEQAKAFVESVDNLRKFDREILNTTLKFGQFSAAMATVGAQLEVRDITRERFKGDAQAGSAKQLADAMSDLNDTVAPFENAFANLRNQVLAEFTKAMTLLMKSTRLLEALTYLVEKIVPQEGKFGSFDHAKFITQLGEDDAAKKFGRPPRLPPGPG